jgi:hypothetical protein
VLRNSKLSTLSGSKSGFNDSPDEVYGLAIVKTPMSARVKYPYIGLSYSRRHLLMWRRNEIPAARGRHIEKDGSCRSSVDLNQTIPICGDLGPARLSQHIGKSFVLASVLTYIDQGTPMWRPPHAETTGDQNFFTYGELSHKT